MRTMVLAAPVSSMNCAASLMMMNDATRRRPTASPVLMRPGIECFPSWRLEIFPAWAREISDNIAATVTRSFCLGGCSCLAYSSCILTSLEFPCLPSSRQAVLATSTGIFPTLACLATPQASWRDWDKLGISQELTRQFSAVSSPDWCF